MEGAIEVKPYPQPLPRREGSSMLNSKNTIHIIENFVHIKENVINTIELHHYN